MSPGRLILRSNWYRRDIDGELDLNQPGIYEWRIECIGTYVGKGLRLKRRLTQYPNNVRRMLQGLPWHGNPDRDYRAIHHALCQAYEGQQRMISVAILELCGSDTLNEREQYWIKLRRAEERSVGLKVLNA